MELEDYITKAIDNIENDLIFRKKNLYEKSNYIKTINKYNNIELLKDNYIKQYDNPEISNSKIQIKKHKEFKKLIEKENELNGLIISNDKNNYKDIEDIKFNEFIATDLNRTINSYIWCDTVGRKLYENKRKYMKTIYAHSLYPKK